MPKPPKTFFGASWTETLKLGLWLLFVLLTAAWTGAWRSRAVVSDVQVDVNHNRDQIVEVKTRLDRELMPREVQEAEYRSMNQRFDDVIHRLDDVKQDVRDIRRDMSATSRSK